MRESFEEGMIEPWQTPEMPDLALIVTQVLLKSQTLWGVRTWAAINVCALSRFYQGYALRFR
ncbi:hypothetical protein [Legionella tunisiensis]|uniref:hypothetical protein n=1 Tax=Legionella tunisiensis TaxID=1034944 RepID=UPI00031C8C73|nr:hypothetical protein [Legionella tunisiensis]